MGLIMCSGKVISPIFFCAFILLSMFAVPVPPGGLAHAAGSVAENAKPGTPTHSLIIQTKQAGKVTLRVEHAFTEDERARGLMHRRELAANAGMLFDFQKTRPVFMWMKNTPLSLDMLFIDEKGRILSIARKTTPFSERIIPSGPPVRYVLEINGGEAERRGIVVGDQVSLPNDAGK